MTRTTPLSSTTLTVRSPDDLLAAVPVILGFEPADSVVMLTFGGRHQFHARVDLPPGGAPFDEEGAAMLSRSLLKPVLTHEVERVVFVLYGADATRVGRVAAALVDDFTAVGVEVIDCLRVHGGRWFSPIRARPGVGAEGVAFDVTGHRFRARAVWEGRVTRTSRDELEATLAPDPERVAATRRALPEAYPLGLVGLDRLLRRATAERAVRDPDDLASLLLALRHPRCRDRAWSQMTREDARAQVDLWTDVLTATPAELVAHPAGVLAFAAWLAGEGALAWCAVDRCLSCDPEHGLGKLIASMLTEAVPPALWSPIGEKG